MLKMQCYKSWLCIGQFLINPSFPVKDKHHIHPTIASEHSLSKKHLQGLLDLFHWRKQGHKRNMCLNHTQWCLHDISRSVLLKTTVVSAQREMDIAKKPT